LAAEHKGETLSLLRDDGRLAGAALACGVIAFPLWLLSFAWVPFAVAGREVGPFRYVILLGEAGALLAAISAIGLGLAARRGANAGTAQHRRASWGLVAGAVALLLVVGPNVPAILGA